MITTVNPMLLHLLIEGPSRNAECPYCIPDIAVRLAQGGNDLGPFELVEARPKILLGIGRGRLGDVWLANRYAEAQSEAIGGRHQLAHIAGPFISRKNLQVLGTELRRVAAEAPARHGHSEPLEQDYGVAGPSP